MSQTPITAGFVRKLLDEHLPIDSDLEAFLIDHFQSTHRRISQGMDRVQKVNLLLSREAPELVYAALQHLVPDLDSSPNDSTNKDGASAAAEAQQQKADSASVPQQAKPVLGKPWLLRAMLAAVAGLGLAIVIAWLGILPHGPRSPRPPARGSLTLRPGGAFVMGSNEHECRSALASCEAEDTRPDKPACSGKRFDWEQPAHDVSLPAFQIDAREVSNSQMADWLNAQSDLTVRDGKVWSAERIILGLGTSDAPWGIAHQRGRFVVFPGTDEQPAVRVSWTGASRYCSIRGQRLPTEAEWEFAARGHSGRTYPFIVPTPTCNGVTFGRSSGLACAGRGVGPNLVGQSVEDRTPEGLYDLAGNASEWVQDRFLPSYQSCPQSCIAPVQPGTSEPRMLRVVRGGNWHDPVVLGRGAGRNAMAEDSTDDKVGFRCADAAPAGQN